ncbi:MAG: hypothetical protein K8T25_14350, partial [Planctomycetia bacterium]|nr:hypothetical protein [Planctomycetia bacterium]
EMTAELTEPIDFSRPRGAGRERPSIGQIICQGGVRLESRSLEEGHVTSIERLQTDNLVVNQQTGEIKSSGAGWVSSIRLRSPNADNMPFNRAAAAAKPAGDRPGLDYLRVRYQQGISGNIQRREVTFADQVSCIFGPVRNWTDEIDSLRADELSPDQILMTCDQLTAYDTGTPNGADSAGARPESRPEARAAPRGALPVGLMGGAGASGAGGKSLELQAIGNARVAGQTFTAQGDRLTYASDKQLLVLEGAGQGDAHLWQKSPGGDPTSHAVARKILYWRATNRVQVLDIRLGDFSQLGGPINPRQREPHQRNKEPLPTGPAIRKDGT